MSQPEMDRFISDVKASSEMQEKMKSFSNNLGGVVTYAQSLGYDITLEDGASGGVELSDDDLGTVAGGNCLGLESLLDL